MDRYLIETPHTKANCLMLLDALNARGYLHHFDWGCRTGVHTGWAIIEAENDAQARLSVPPLVRDLARIVRLNKFSEEEVAAMHEPDDGDKPLPQFPTS
jgi:hypothetical protein